jgi:hypothetical protein
VQNLSAPASDIAARVLQRLEQPRRSCYASILRRTLLLQVASADKAGMGAGQKVNVELVLLV